MSPPRPSRYSQTVNGVEYTIRDHVRFVRDMRRAGLKPQLYHGRFFFHGPAVVVGDRTEPFAHTAVELQWDQYGTDQWFVYPRETDRTLEGAREEGKGARRPKRKEKNGP